MSWFYRHRRILKYKVNYALTSTYLYAQTTNFPKELGLEKFRKASLVSTDFVKVVS